MEPVLGKQNVEKIVESVRRLESLASVRELTQLMTTVN